MDKCQIEQNLLRRLLDEIEKLGERFSGNEDALGALQAVQNWAISETVEDA